MALQIRRGPTVDREEIVPVVGELIYDTDSKGLFIGDGVTPGGTGVSGYTNEEIQDLAAVLLTGGVHSGISFDYKDSLNRIDATISADVVGDTTPQLGGDLDLNSKNITGTGNISITGSITADYIDAKGNLSGSIYSDSSTLLIDGTEGTIILDSTINGHVIPKTNIAWDLGSPSYRFRDLYVSASGVKLGDATISSNDTRIDLPVGSTVNGLAIVTGTLGDSIVADLKGSVFGDDSSIIIDSTANSIFVDTIDAITIETETITSPVLTSLNVGTANNPTYLTVSSNIEPLSIFRGITDNITPPSIFIETARGSLTAPETLQAGDQGGGILFKTYDGSVYKSTTAFLNIIADDSVLSDTNPKSEFLVAVSAGGSDFSLFNFNGDGTLELPGAVQLAVYANDAARAAAIPTPVQGMMVFMQSGTVPTVTNKTVVYDGSAWTTV